MTGIKESTAKEALAISGLAHRVRPVFEDRSSVAEELFLVDDDLKRAEKALVLLIAEYEAAGLTTSDDRHVFEKETSRRRKRIARLAKERDALFSTYAQELSESCAVHPGLGRA